MNRMTGCTDAETDFAAMPAGRRQAGGGLLGVVAVLGIAMVMVQGTMYYRAKGSAKFVGAERNKILAQQMAEAGVEANIADLGSRKFKVTSAMANYTTYDHKTLGDGNYTSQVSMVAPGPLADTVDLTSTGRILSGTQTIQARLRLKNYLDSTRTITPTTTVTTTVKDPATMPAFNSTPEYASCKALPNLPSSKCDVCHLPGGSVNLRQILNVQRNLVDSHIGHVGDYVSADGTCNLYSPTSTSVTTYDTTYVVDTIVKVKTLSWK